MPEVQVPRERSREIREAYAQWQRTLPREPGQVGMMWTEPSEGPPFIIAGRIEAYSDFDPVCFYGVDEVFVAYLKEQDIPADIFDNGRLRD